jgi:hypothetical protein
MLLRSKMFKMPQAETAFVKALRRYLRSLARRFDKLR